MNFCQRQLLSKSNTGMNFLSPSSPMSTSRYQSALSNHNFLQGIVQTQFLARKGWMQNGLTRLRGGLKMFDIHVCLATLQMKPLILCRWTVKQPAREYIGEVMKNIGADESSKKTRIPVIIPSIRRDMTVEEDTRNRKLLTLLHNWRLSFGHGHNWYCNYHHIHRVFQDAPLLKAVARMALKHDLGTMTNWAART